MTRAGARRGGLGAITATLLLVLAYGTPAEAQDQERTPIVALDRESVAAGEVVRVSGVNWPPSVAVNVEVCGNLAAGGSIDCDLRATSSVVANNVGFFATNVTVNPPPSPCPCVVKASSLTTSDVATANIAIAGVPTLPEAPVGGVPPVESFLSIDNAELHGSGPWTSWFGLSPQRTLEFAIHNTGDVTIDPPPLVLNAGHGDDPTGYVPSIDPEPLEPGESRTITVPIEFDSLSFGRLTVRGEISGLHKPIVFRAKTNSFPWGVIVLALVVVQLIFLHVRNRLRARLPEEPERVVDATGDGTEAPVERQDGADTADLQV